MCFSAGGSFALAGVLAGVGTVSVMQKQPPTHRLFAVAPVLFATQQVAEGIVWLTMADASRTALHDTAVMAYLGFALVLWPIYLPVSLRRAERDPARRRLLAVIGALGLAVAVAAVISLSLWPPDASIAGRSIHYEFTGGKTPVLYILLLVAYVIPTIVPFFVSTIPLTRLIGITLLVSLLVTALVERKGVTSVWCFFAAILSAQILFAVRRSRITQPGRS
jgi:hypothetical protein